MIDLISQKFEKIYLHKESLQSPLAEKIFKTFDKNKIEIVDDKPPVYQRGDMTADVYKRSKTILFVTPFAGQFFKRCPGAKKGLACCNYFVLNLGQQCDMDCSYCYLQSFLNTPYTVLYSNIEKAFLELEEIYNDHSGSQVRIGTGEVVDSLSLDPLTLFSHSLIDFFKGKKNWNLEFKTKSNYVDQFLDCEHDGNVIVSWSINPQAVVAHEEHGTASLEERLSAARRCLDKKFKIALHIDPVIWHESWKENYSLLVDEVTRRFQPQDLPYISLGALRFQSEQKDLMRERFGMTSWVNQAEMFRGAAGKLRYDQSLREEMFQFIIQKFKEKNPAWKIFLCMETPESWINATGSLPYKQEDIRPLFSKQRLESTLINSSATADRPT